jgi:hypothetical protein
MKAKVITEEEKKEAREKALQLYGQIVEATNCLSIRESDAVFKALQKSIKQHRNLYKSILH